MRISLATRLGIAHESAAALAYLHSSTSTPILHGDVKSSNILLDTDNQAKVSDFGASILAPTDKSQFITLVHGTCGYLDPEYMQTNLLTDKSDVYAFGVVVFQVLTGKKAVSQHLLRCTVDGAEPGGAAKLDDLVDPRLGARFSRPEAAKLAGIALLCTSEAPGQRPAMATVLQQLGAPQ